jgi:hypothetical protein
MRINVPVSGTENETASELKRILAQPMLLVTGGARPLACGGVVAAEQMQQIRGFQAGSFIGCAMFIDQKGKIDARFFAEEPGVIRIAESDGGQPRAGCLKFLLSLAQLRDMLTAEDSTVMAKKNNDGGATLPKRTEPPLAPIRVRQSDWRKRFG